MNVSERDELLVRIDERVEDIQIKVLVQEKHLRDLNGEVRQNALNIARNTTARKIGAWFGGALILGIITILVNIICTI